MNSKDIQPKRRKQNERVHSSQFNGFYNRPGVGDAE